MAVQMELSRILIRELTDYQLIELKEVDGERGFPIVIGLPEAQAIERRLKGLRAPRPQTHELLATVIEELGGKLEAITITDLDDHTFFATLSVRLPDGEVREIDSRPSDAIALAVRNETPIFAEDALVDDAGITEQDEEAGEEEEEMVEELRRFLDEVSPEDFGS